MPTNAPDVQKISLSHIDLDPTLDRSHFPPERMAGLAQSMKERGLINAISVRIRRDRFEIMVGNRRFKAAQSLGWTDIDCRVYPAETSDREADLLSLVDNLQREDLSPIDQARAFLRLKREHGLTQTQIAESIGKTQSLIAQTLDLLELPPAVQEIINQLIISPSHCRILLKIRNDSSQIRFAKLAAQEGWSVRQLEEAVAEFQRTGHPKSISEVVNGKSASGQTSGLSDPLADLWTGLKATRELANDVSWEVAYGPAEFWNFRLEPRSADRAERFRNWFLAMGRAISQRLGGADKNSLKAPAFTLAELTPERHILLEWNDVEGAERYELFYGDQSDALKMYAGPEPITRAAFEINASTYPHNQVFLAVRAFNSVAGVGPFSDKKQIDLPPLLSKPQ